jgi:hypothetical protein
LRSIIERRLSHATIGPHDRVQRCGEMIKLEDHTLIASVQRLIDEVGDVG